MESGGSNHGNTHTRIRIEPWPKPMAKDPGKARETNQRNRNPQRTNGHFFSHQRMGGRTGEQAPHTKTQMQRPIYVGSLGATIRHKPNPSRALRLLEKHTRKVMKEEIDCLSNLKREPGVANQQRQYQTRNPHYSSKGCKNMA